MQTTISDLVQISPEDLQKPSAESIEDNINAKYANKVIQRIGLCICVFDILATSDGLIGHGTGIVNVNAEFRLVVFRPFKGEIISGRISNASEDGMRISLDFFDDIFVPAGLLFPNSSFNVQEQCWVWSNEGQEYFYDKTDWVRFRVEQEHWTDLSPISPSEREHTALPERKSPYCITPYRVPDRLPVLQGGDVEIQLSRRPKDRLVLHSIILILHSLWFKMSLSETWTKGEQAGPRQYVLEFDFDVEGTACLVKRSTASADGGAPTNNSSDFYIRSNDATPATLDEEQVEKCNWWVEAYRCFFNVMFHEPLDIDCEKNPRKALKCLRRTVQVADMFLNPDLLELPAKLFIQENVPQFQDEMLKEAPLLLEICAKYEFDTFAKDTICHLVGDETRDDNRIEKVLSIDLAEIVLVKREELRRMMRDMAFELLTCNTTRHQHTPEAHVTAAAACFREYIADLLRKPKHWSWKDYAEPYRKLAAEVDNVDRTEVFRCHRFRTEAIEQRAYTHFAALHRTAHETVEPLFKSNFIWLKQLADYPKPKPKELRKEWRYRGFSCVKITDRDLPWNR
ncbi:MAG: hypothetical protein Q9225_002496 [Loekoesia sp. 1 TL-2023]